MARKLTTEKFLNGKDAIVQFYSELKMDPYVHKFAISAVNFSVHDSKKKHICICIC